MSPWSIDRIRVLFHACCSIARPSSAVYTTWNPPIGKLLRVEEPGVNLGGSVPSNVNLVPWEGESICDGKRKMLRW